MCTGGGGSSAGGYSAPIIQIIQQPAKTPAKGANTSSTANAGGAPIAAASSLLTDPQTQDSQKLQLAKNTLLGL